MHNRRQCYISDILGSAVLELKTIYAQMCEFLCYISYPKILKNCYKMSFDCNTGINIILDGTNYAY